MSKEQTKQPFEPGEHLTTEKLSQNPGLHMTNRGPIFIGKPARPGKMVRMRLTERHLYIMDLMLANPLQNKMWLAEQVNMSHNSIVAITNSAPFQEELVRRRDIMQRQRMHQANERLHNIHTAAADIVMQHLENEPSPRFALDTLKVTGGQLQNEQIVGRQASQSDDGGGISAEDLAKARKLMARLKEPEPKTIEAERVEDAPSTQPAGQPDEAYAGK